MNNTEKYMNIPKQNSKDYQCRIGGDTSSERLAANDPGWTTWLENKTCII